MKNRTAVLRGKRLHKLWQKNLKKSKRVRNLIPKTLRTSFSNPDLKISRCMTEYSVGSRVLDAVLQFKNNFDVILEFKTCSTMSHSKLSCVKLLKTYQQQLKDSYTLYKQSVNNKRNVHVFLLLYFTLDRKYVSIKLI